MAQQVAVTLNTLVYNPSGSNAGTALWTERSGGIGTSFSKLSQRSSTNGAGAFTTEHNLNVPIIATVNSDCACTGTVLGTDWFNIRTGTFAGATAAQRLDLYNRLKDYVASATFKSAVVDMDPAFG